MYGAVKRTLLVQHYIVVAGCQVQQNQSNLDITKPSHTSSKKNLYIANFVNVRYWYFSSKKKSNIAYLGKLPSSYLGKGHLKAHS